MKGYQKHQLPQRTAWSMDGRGLWQHEGRAGFWPTKQLAEDDAVMLEHHDIAITTPEGQRHVCKGYQVEERAPGEFVVCVDAPFASAIGTDQPDDLAIVS